MRMPEAGRPGEARLGVALAIALALALSCGGDEADRTAAAPGRAWMSGLDRGIGSAVSPGDLAAAHAQLEGVLGCAECHAGVDGTPDARCVACHEDVGARRREQLGFHGALPGDCAGCHAEHRGRDADLMGLDRAGFNHAQALFPLHGAHGDVDCDECHVRAHPETGRRGFHPILGIAHERCATCHADPHRDGFASGRDCAACHGEAGWGARFLEPSAADAGFDHGRDTRFPLAGAHARVACAGCHTSERVAAARAHEAPPGTGLPTECGGCHRDVHEAALGSDCARCHGETAWKGPEAGFDHERHARFALDALHARLACGDCHADARFTAAGRECESCHADAAGLLAGRFADASGAPDPHAGRLACRQCHPAELARPRGLDYERLCAGCHTPEYGALLATRRRLLEATALRAEAASPAGPGRERAARRARSGAHNPELAEAILRAALAAPAPAEDSWKD